MTDQQAIAIMAAIIWTEIRVPDPLKEQAAVDIAEELWKKTMKRVGSYQP
jgi:hypothetical protein